MKGYLKSSILLLSLSLGLNFAVSNYSYAEQNQASSSPMMSYQPQTQAASPMMQGYSEDTASAGVSPMMQGYQGDEESASGVSPMMQGYGANQASQTAYTQNQPKVDDPWESMNRVIFSFDDALDEYFLKPVAELYNKIMPKPLNRGIHNIYENVSNVQNIGNDLLQANFYQATSDTWRLFINTTAGLGGTFDVASDIGLYQNDEDFGLTLARWGYTESRYVVLPFFGPSTIRDTIGMPIDYYAFSPYPRIENMRLRYSLYALDIVNQRAQLLKYQDLYEKFSLDKYTFVRDAYLQRRAGQIQRNKELSDPYFTLGAPQKPVSEDTEQKAHTGNLSPSYA